jgi:hypothetical protein
VHRARCHGERHARRAHEGELTNCRSRRPHGRVRAHTDLPYAGETCVSLTLRCRVRPACTAPAMREYSRSRRLGGFERATHGPPPFSHRHRR